jgi:mycothiol synthase
LAEEKKPLQLQMLWPPSRAGTPPHVSVAEGYTLRCFRPEEMPAYLELAHAAGFDRFDAESVTGYMTHNLPGGFFVVEADAGGELAASAMAQDSPDQMHPGGSVLGWVMGRPAHSGKGLGMTVCAAATAQLLRAGYQRIYLKTDEFRLAAIKIYFKLGWLPLLFAPDMEERWRNVCEQLSWNFEPQRWRSMTGLSGTAEGPADSDRLERYPQRYKWLPGREHRGYAQIGDVDAFGDEWLYRSAALGSGNAEPGSVPAGAQSPLKLTFTAGSAGLPEGSRVTFVIRGQNPLGSGKALPELRTSAKCELEPRTLGFELKSGSLTEGQSVSLLFAPFTWTALAGRRELKVVIACPGDPQRRLPAPVVIEVLPAEAERLEITLSLTHRPGSRIPATVTVRDHFDNRVPVSGIVTVEDVKAPMRDGLACCEIALESSAPVRAGAQMGKLSAISNPSTLSDELQLFVGDLHCHDFLSEAEGYPDAVYRWARQDRALDFVSVVPQAHGWLDNETWTLAKYMSERHLEEGRFVSLLGFEWQHTAFGDKVVHYLGGDQPYLPVDDPRYRSAQGLYSALRQSDALVIAHHPSYPPGNWCSSTDFDAVETDVERLVELWSMHGSSEGHDPSDRPLHDADPDRTVYAALRRGLRVGFVAGSDTHSGRPGGSAREPRSHWGGLAAVWAKDLTRKSIFEALRARRTYALTRARIVLRMTVNGAPMGSELPDTERAEILIEAWAPGKIKEVQVLKNAELLREFDASGDSTRIELEDATAGPAFYHCRVKQDNGELAVCSPVWIG